jgi:microcystin degradation protein MlrC
MHIAVGGFQHETNTFAPSKATYEDFTRGGAWPGLLAGDALFDGVKGINLPVTGFIEGMQGSGHVLVPTAWAAASPSAHVTRDAFERICALIVEPLHAIAPDAVYLDLHGAMVAEHYDDGEAEILRRVRDVVGERVPVVASLDLHANVTPEMLARADVLIAYRTYPHVDMAETGGRVAHMLRHMLGGDSRPHVAARRVPYLIPLSPQCTDLEPARTIYARLAALESAAVPSLSFAPGFPAADFPGCGPVVWAYGHTQADADHAADTLAALVESHEGDWDAEVLAPGEAVQRAMQIARRASRPVVIADTQDNPGAGGNSDTTGMLRALIENRAERAAIGLIVDPEAAAAAHRAGVGREIDIALGGRSNIAGDAPLRARFTVEALADGKLVGKGPFYRGTRMNLGPSACLRIGGVHVVVACSKAQLADQEMYRYVGIEPTQQAILVNKSSVHFRADFAPIAEAILVAKAPGPMAADPSELPWKHLAPGIRLRPKGPAFGSGSAA